MNRLTNTSLKAGLQNNWYRIFLLAGLALILQSCLGIGEDTTFQGKTSGNNGQIGINQSAQAAFKGKFYLTIDRNLYVLDDKRNLTQLTHNIDVRDPVVSPDGKWIAFIIRYKDYADLVYMSVSGGDYTTIVSGNGAYKPNPPFDTPKSTHHWFSQPAWAADSQHLVVLSDVEKNYWDPGIVGYGSFILDLQLFSVDMRDTNIQDMLAVAYSNIGDGGLRDPSYRPGHDDQIMYSSYKYDKDGQKQVVQINIEDVNAIPNDIKKHRYQSQYKYHPGQGEAEIDPSVNLTPDVSNLVNLEPSFSPDGNTILYVRRDSTAGTMTMYTMPMAEGVTSDPNNPRFDPNNADNKQKALLPYNQSKGLLSRQYISKPIWSPDGKQIAYYDYTNNTFDLWLATVVKDAGNGTYSIKKDSAVQLTHTNGDLDSGSRASWVQ